MFDTLKKFNAIILEDNIHLFLKFENQNISKFEITINSNFMSNFKGGTSDSRNHVIDLLM